MYFEIQYAQSNFHLIFYFQASTKETRFVAACNPPVELQQNWYSISSILDSQSSKGGVSPHFGGRYVCKLDFYLFSFLHEYFRIKLKARCFFLVCFLHFLLGFLWQETQNTYSSYWSLWFILLLFVSAKSSLPEATRLLVEEEEDYYWHRVSPLFYTFIIHCIYLINI